MSIIIAVLWFIAGGFLAVILMPFFAIAKREDEQREVILSYMKEDYNSGNLVSGHIV